MLLDLLFNQDTTVVSLLITFAFLIYLLLLIPITNYSFFLVFSLIITFVSLIWCLYLWCLYLWCLFLWCLFLWCIYDGLSQTFQCVCNIESLHLSFGIDAVGLSLI